MVQIMAKFKKDDGQYDGLEAVAKELIAKPLNPRVVIAVLEVTNVNHNVLDGSDTPKVRFRQVEALDGDAAAKALALMNARYAERTGRDDSQATLFDAWAEDGDQDGDPRSGEEILAERAEARYEAKRQEATIAAFAGDGDQDGPGTGTAAWPGDVDFIAPAAGGDGDTAGTVTPPADEVSARRGRRRSS